MSNTPTDKCPHCGAKFQFQSDGVSFFTCHTVGSLRSDYCKERSVHAATEKQRFDLSVRLLEAELRAKKAEARVAELDKEVAEALELAWDQCGAERLSGNIVKEEYWKGELSALHRMRRTLGQAMPGGGK